MSSIHPTWELEVNQSALVLMPCPGTKEADLDATLTQLSQSGVRVIISATTQHELARKSLSHLGSAIREHNMQWLHLPIEDDSIPDDVFEEKWNQVSFDILSELQQGKVALHCMGGSGRTGLLAARILLALGWSPDEIFAQVKSLRPNAFSKAEQRSYVEALMEE